jgi:hypothetical protein
MVLSPLNWIVDDALIPLVESERDSSIVKAVWGKSQVEHAVPLWRCVSPARCLGEFGMEPDFEKQKFVKKLIKNPAFGELSGTNSLVHVTGFTAAFLLTLPWLFVQWRDHEDGDESNKKQHEVLEFLGQQCHWPSFSDEKVQRTSSPKVAHGEGSTLPNAKSLPLCSFLPNLFDLTKVFNDCLDGSTEWESVHFVKKPKWSNHRLESDQQNQLKIQMKNNHLQNSQGDNWLKKEKKNKKKNQVMPAQTKK